MSMPQPTGYNSFDAESNAVYAVRSKLNRTLDDSGLGSHFSDKLMDRGNKSASVKKFAAADKALVTVHATILAIIPSLAFAVSVSFSSWASGLQNCIFWNLLYLVVVCYSIVYITAIVRSAANGPSKMQWRRWAGRLALIATCVGVAVGVLIYFQYFIFYQAYQMRRSYANIAASQKIEQFMDAGRITFTGDTTLDVSRAVGYKNAETREVLCVAPIIDNSASRDQEVNFFAIGSNCCQARASFDCDDASEANLDTLLVLEPGTLTSPWSAWLVDPLLATEPWDHAVRMQQAAFDVTPSKRYRYVRWTKTPMAVSEAYYNRGLEAMILSIVAYVIISVCVAINHVYESTK